MLLYRTRVCRSRLNQLIDLYAGKHTLIFTICTHVHTYLLSSPNVDLAYLILSHTWYLLIFGIGTLSAILCPLLSLCPLVSISSCRHFAIDRHLINPGLAWPILLTALLFDFGRFLPLPAYYSPRSHLVHWQAPRSPEAQFKRLIQGCCTHYRDNNH